MKNNSAPFVAICKHEHGAEPGAIYVGTYDEVFQKAVVWWEGYDLAYDAGRMAQMAEPFYDPDDEDNNNVVYVGRDKKKKIFVVDHADGQGPQIWIQQADSK